MSIAKQQFNVALPADLVVRTKHCAIDAQQSLSDLVASALERHLTTTEALPMDQHPARLTLQPMVHVADMGAALDFYAALGASVQHGSRDGDFAMLRIGDAGMSLLGHPPNPEQDEGRVELNFETSEPLAELESRLRAAGVEIVRPTTDEAFGRQLQLRSPDGLLVKVNELSPDLYT